MGLQLVPLSFVVLFFTFLTLFFPDPVLLLRQFAFGTTEGDPFLFRALYGILATMIVGIVVNLFTKPPLEKDIEGYTMDTIDEAMIKFKGGVPNLTTGKTVNNLSMTLDDTIPEGLVFISQDVADKTKSLKQDIIYLSDQRWYLGGLRSGHFRLGGIHNKNSETVLISKKTLSGSYLLKNNPIFIKKII